MTMHMDALPCREGWLTFLASKIRGTVAAAGVRMDHARVPDGVLHVLGMFVDLDLVRKLGIDFFPDLPHLDVGDKVTVRLREAGYGVHVCPNTFRTPELIERIDASSPLKRMPVDRSFDDEGNVIFLHLGRGLRKSTGEHVKGMSIAEWVEAVRTLTAG
jgi:hypothetical protein